ncbi:hypothetical protein [Rhizohabitans arisaemae]|uniref:hypothetical protein n=1 Tax=Rhizohabitans arisaemae TaxID=2720610 RepID=UPI0024B081DD|nr:hypothetical protein [Rhizohabitans arisaemae]
MDLTRAEEAIRRGTASQWTTAVLEEIVLGKRLEIAAVRHPLGFLCLPIERSGEDGVCVHLWSPSLPEIEPTTSPVHAHSWDLLSHVLYGELRNNLFHIVDAPEGPYRLFEVISGADEDEIRPTERLVSCRLAGSEIHRAGDTYSLPTGRFHTTEVEGTAVTLALGQGRPGTVDLSLGDPDVSPHRVRRLRDHPEETLVTIKMIMRWLRKQ